MKKGDCIHYPNAFASTMDNEKIAFGNKLLDAKWLEKAQTVIERDERFCQCCGKNSADLEVHFFHITAADPWDEPAHHLTTLCPDCHVIEHATRNAAEQRFLNSLEQLKFLSVDVLELLPHVLQTFQSRAYRLSDDRLRRMNAKTNEFSADSTVAQYRQDIKEVTERLFSRLDDGLSDVSEEFYDLQSQTVGMIVELRKRGDAFIQKAGSIAPPDSETLAQLQPSTGSSLLPTGR